MSIGLTASPIFSLGNASEMACKIAMDQLESNLDSTIISCNQNMVYEYIALPRERLVKYESSPLDSEILLTIEALPSEFPFSQLKNKLSYIYEDLGKWSLSRYISKRLRDPSYGQKATMTLDREKKREYEMQREFLRKCSDQINFADKPSSIEEYHTPKVIKLLNLLKNIQEKSLEDFRGILFVQRRVAVSCLTDIIRENKKLSAYFKPAELTGHGSIKIDEMKMKTAIQKKVIYC